MTTLLAEEKKVPDVNTAEALAQTTLERLGITHAPVNPITVARQLGYAVNGSIFWSPNMSGRVQKVNGKIRIDVNAKDHPNRRNFTIAHEIGHALLHLQGVDDATISDPEYRWTASEEQSPYKEVEANRFAAALLMPPAWVRQAFETTKDIGALAHTFEVSNDAMRFQLEKLGLIPK
jgi:predicted transcriptional regulator